MDSDMCRYALDSGHAVFIASRAVGFDVAAIQMPTPVDDSASPAAPVTWEMCPTPRSLDCATQHTRALWHREAALSTSAPTFPLESFQLLSDALQGKRRRSGLLAFARSQELKDSEAASPRLSQQSCHDWSPGSLLLVSRPCRSRGLWQLWQQKNWKRSEESDGPSGDKGAGEGGAVKQLSNELRNDADVSDGAGVKRPQSASILTFKIASDNDEEGCVPTITLGDVFMLAPSSRVEKLRNAVFPLGFPNPLLFFTRVEMDFWRSMFKRDIPKSLAAAHLAGIFGDGALQGGKLAFWTDKWGAKTAAIAAVAADIVLDGKITENTKGLRFQHDAHPAPAPLNMGEEAVTEPIPRIPSYLLPRRAAATPTQNAAEEARQKEGDAEDTFVKKWAWELLKRLGWSVFIPKSSTESVGGVKVVPVPLAEAFGCLQDHPSWCCLASCHAGLDTLCTTAADRITRAPCPDEVLAAAANDPKVWPAEDDRPASSDKGGTVPTGVPVYLVPGISLMLPTSLGPVRFQPAFLSNKQVSVTWTAVRSLVRDCLMMKRSRSRHRARRELEAVGARLVGVEARGEEGGDEGQDEEADPPETQEVLEELGEPGASRSKKGRQLMPRPGLLGMLGTVALGALVVVADIGEVVCSFGDRVAFATPLGHTVLGALPPKTSVETMPLSSYIRSVEQHNASFLTLHNLDSKPQPPQLPAEGTWAGPDNGTDSGGEADFPFPAEAGGPWGDQLDGAASPLAPSPPRDSAGDVDWRELNDGMANGFHTILRSGLNAVIASRLGMPHNYLTYSMDETNGSGRKGKLLRVIFNAEGPDPDAVSRLQDDAAEENQDVVLELDYDKAFHARRQGAGAGKAGGAEDSKCDFGRGVLLIGEIDVDITGATLPLPLSPIGFGNGARLADT